MILTGKCKEAFEKWLFSQEHDMDTGLEKFSFNIYEENIFNQLPESMQCGPLFDFFDSVDMKIEISCMIKEATSKVFWLHNLIHNSEIMSYDTRTEAQTAAIEKANEIYNSTT